jgi:hypothetical protein
MWFSVRYIARGDIEFGKIQPTADDQFYIRNREARVKHEDKKADELLHIRQGDIWPAIASQRAKTSNQME